MTIAKAYDDYLQSIKSGWTHKDALNHSANCWNISESDLAEYVKYWESFK